MPPFCVTAVTGPTRSVFGVDGGSGEIVTSTTPGITGVAGPHAGVKSTTCPSSGVSLIPFSVRRCPVPRHVPKNLTRSTWSAPASSIPIEERSPSGGWSSTPSRIMTPLGWPSFQLKRSPLTPATVAVELSRFCIDVTVSLPRIVFFASVGLTA